MARDDYWALRSQNQSEVIKLLREALFSTDIRWNESKGGYVVSYNYYSARDFKFPDPKKYGHYQLGPDGKELTKLGLDLELIRTKLCPSGRLDELVVPGSVTQSEFVLRPDYVQKSDLESLRDEGKQLKAKYAPPSTYRGY